MEIFYLFYRLNRGTNQAHLDWKKVLESRWTRKVKSFSRRPIINRALVAIHEPWRSNGELDNEYINSTRNTLQLDIYAYLFKCTSKYTLCILL